MSSHKSINPASNQHIQSYDTFSDEAVLEAISNAHQGYLLWKKQSMSDRCAQILRLADQLDSDYDTYARIITAEMGKTLNESEAEVKKCVTLCRYYAEHAESLLKDVHIKTEFYKSYKSYQPVGVILGIMPWNFPFWQVFRFAIPALMVGNSVILRHAYNVTGCALGIEALFKKIGFSENVFQTIIVDHHQIPAIIAHPHIQGVSLTGSTYAGSQVAQQAGLSLKKSVLELGGSDPYIILEDADLDLAVKACTTSRLLNAGQSCIAAKRFIVLEKVYQSFVDKMIIAFKAIQMGDPLAPQTNIGPMATNALRDQLHKQVQTSIQKGATCLIGGSIPDNTGAYYPPTLLVDVKPGMPAYDEELFGPVGAVILAQSEEEAINIANSSIYGLGGAVFTQDLEKGERIARNEIESGSCVVNGFVTSDPKLPFGGIKQSGYGRELSVEGLHEFANIKTIIIRI